MNVALVDSGALTEDRASNTKVTNAWHKYYDLKWNVTSGFARGYKPLTGRDKISRERIFYVNNFIPAIIVEYLRLQEAQAMISPHLATAYTHAENYKTFCKDKAVAAAEKSAANQQLQDNMDEVEQHYGNQPQGMEMGQSSSRAASALFRSPQAVPRVIAGGSTDSTGSSTRTSTPIPRFQDPIGAINGTRGDLGFLAQAIMSIGNSTTGTVRSNADNDITSKKRRKLNAKQEYVDSLWKRVSNYQSANQLGRIDATICQIDVTEQEIDQLHRELVNEMD
jgi:hypothetical protein